MHEASLVRSLLSQVAVLFDQHGGEAVERIRVEMGPLSGVERPLVEIAFADQVDSTACRGAELQIEEVPLSAVCRDCGNEFDIQRFRFLCPSCESTQIRVISGDEFRLLDIDIRQTAVETSSQEPS
ncbi:MAG: hydrogenase maturation nickel metallochaperone HypA/HybF [Planctomycetota bacterium]|jgi:hydrogenase nickel incorporation protein HypA/HybF